MMSKKYAEIKVGRKYKGLINGCIFKVVEERKEKLRNDIYYLVEFEDREQNKKPEWARIYSKSFLEHLQIKEYL